MFGNSDVERIRAAYRAGEMPMEDVERELRRRSRVMGRIWGIVLFFVMSWLPIWKMIQKAQALTPVLVMIIGYAVLWWLAGRFYGVMMYRSMRRRVME